MSPTKHSVQRFKTVHHLKIRYVIDDIFNCALNSGTKSAFESSGSLGKDLFLLAAFLRTVFASVPPSVAPIYRVISDILLYPPFLIQAPCIFAATPSLKP